MSKKIVLSGWNNNLKRKLFHNLAYTVNVLFVDFDMKMN